MSPSPSSALASASLRPGRAGAKTVGSGRVAGILTAIRGRDTLDTRGNDFNGAAFNQQRFSVNQGIGNLFMRRFEDSAESLTGYIHFFSGIGLVKPLQIRKADRFKLIDR